MTTTGGPRLASLQNVGDSRHERPNRKRLEREVRALADTRHEEIVVVADQPECVEAGDAAADFHGHQP